MALCIVRPGRGVKLVRRCREKRVLGGAGRARNVERQERGDWARCQAVGNRAGREKHVLEAVVERRMGRSRVDEMMVEGERGDRLALNSEYQGLVVAAAHRLILYPARRRWSSTILDSGILPSRYIGTTRPSHLRILNLTLLVTLWSIPSRLAENHIPRIMPDGAYHGRRRLRTSGRQPNMKSNMVVQGKDVIDIRSSSRLPRRKQFRWAPASDQGSIKNRKSEKEGRNGANLKDFHLKESSINHSAAASSFQLPRSTNPTARFSSQMEASELSPNAGCELIEPVKSLYEQRKTKISATELAEQIRVILLGGQDTSVYIVPFSSMDI
ncbi:hypothetical protein FB45DRAFT_876945 [Roridomyces roridus]|uniref:Uncharacterized protein n=1 Tax=Roridomyces roridus TaxID=1738132 RepID=A0AAD7B2L7_9AGAR|nr:hypothetical protein FB45DRAFT_876945 [Roridomyces roridus]